MTSDIRGVRNNNPGNLRRLKGVTWVGQRAEQRDPDFVEFVTPEYGIRAMGKVLRSYRNAGYNTIYKVINRWAPESDGNDTKSYIDRVCKDVGILPIDHLRIENPEVIVPLVKSMISVECSGYKYPEETIEQGLIMAGYPLPGAGLQPGDGLAAPHEPDLEMEPYTQPEVAPAQSAGELDMSDDQFQKLLAALAQSASAAATQAVLAQQAPPVVVTSVPAPAKDFGPPLTGQPGSPTNINIPDPAAMGGLATTPIVQQQPGSIVAATLPGAAGTPILRSPLATSLAMSLGLALPWLWNGVIHVMAPGVPTMPDEVAAPLTVFLADFARQKLKI